jgi:hypothetical protein
MQAEGQGGEGMLAFLRESAMIGRLRITPVSG